MKSKRKERRRKILIQRMKSQIKNLKWLINLLQKD